MAIIDNIIKIINELEGKVSKKCKVGIGAPGSISRLTGLMRNSNTVCLNGMPLKVDIEARLNRKIRIANDANCFALAESISGDGKDAQVVFGVIIGTGVGGGIVVNKQVLTGTQGIAGEWGHNTFGSEQRSCYCGRLDCVETYLSGGGLLRTYQKLSGKSISNVEALVNLMNQGDDSALGALVKYQQYLARALATVINILDPNVVVLGGGLSNIQSLYTNIANLIKPHVFSDSYQTQIVENKLGDSAGVLGAAMLWQ